MAAVLPSLSNVATINNPEIIIHTQFIRLVRLLAVNIEIYRHLRRLLPSLLHVRDYIAGVQKHLLRFQHTTDFYESWLNLNLMHYAYVPKTIALEELFLVSSQIIGSLKELSKSKFFQDFPPPDFSIYNDPTGTLVNGEVPGLGYVKIVAKPEDGEQTSRFSMKPFLDNYIHVDEMTEVLRNIHLSKGLMVGGRRRKNHSRHDAVIDHILAANSIPQTTQFYFNPVSLQTKVSEFNNRLLKIIKQLCHDKGIENEFSNECFIYVSDLLERISENLKGYKGDIKDLFSGKNGATINHDASAELRRLQDQIASQTADADRANAALRRCEDDLRKARQHHQTTATEVERLNEELRTATEKIKELTEVKPQTEKTINDLEAANVDLRKQLAAAEAKSAEVYKANARIAELEAEIARLQGQVARLQEDCARAKAEHAAQMAELVEKNKKDVAKLQIDCETEKANLQTKINRLKDVNEDINQKLEDTSKTESERIKGLEEQLQQNLVRITELEKLVQSSTDRDHSRVNTIAKLNQQYDDLESRTNRMLDDHRSKKHAIENELNELKKTSKSKIDALEAEKIKNLATIAELKEKIAELEKRIAELEAANKLCNDTIATQMQTIAANATEIARLREALKHAEKNDSDEITRLKGTIEKLETNIRVAETEIVDATAKNVRLTADLATQIKKSNKENEELRSELQTVRAQLEAKIKEFDDLGTQKDQAITKLQNEIVGLREQIRSLEQKISQCENELETLRKEKDKIEKDFDGHKTSSQTELHDITSKLEEKEQELEKLNAAKTELEARYAADIAALQSQITALEAAIKECREGLETLKSEKANLEQKLSDCDTQKNNLSDSLSKTKEELAAATSTIEHLKAQISALPATFANVVSADAAALTTAANEATGSHGEEPANVQQQNIAITNNLTVLRGDMQILYARVKVSNENASFTDKASTSMSIKLNLTENIPNVDLSKYVDVNKNKIKDDKKENLIELIKAYNADIIKLAEKFGSEHSRPNLSQEELVRIQMHIQLNSNARKLIDRFGTPTRGGQLEDLEYE